MADAPSPVSAEALLELMRARRSVRRLSADPIDETTERRLLEAARAAPSAGNAQPWAFVRVRDAALREAVARAAYGQRFVAEAPLLVVVCADLEQAERAYGTRGRELYCLQDTAAAAQNLLLCAHACGLGACWIGAFREAELAALLGLRPVLRPVALLAIGWPAEQPGPPGRRPLEEISWRIEASTRGSR
jgi:nitroreductase